MIYLDTSILVSALTNETGTAAVHTWLSRQMAGEVTISDWVVTEFSSALAIKMRTGQIQPEHRAAALAAFTRIATVTSRIVTVERADFHKAAAFADQSSLNIRAGDALHLAICFGRGATLCTLDRKLADAASLAGVAVEMP